ncbi:MAG: N-acetylmuramoyl-L-alanine amidase [Phycisphaerae bacterium]|nr:MAG: N-acetylmuramoyl-L-alanine amidase [Phycisphaerae bacterium]MCQ3919449.1 N-acetylmuramoyl-L-alanine amidase [Planctomycetota bacterium]
MMLRHMRYVLGAAVLTIVGCGDSASDRFAHLPDVVFPSDAPRPSTLAPDAPPPSVARRLPTSAYPAGWIPPGGKISGRWSSIVIHHSATDVGGAARFDRDHRISRGWDELGYHFVIGNGTDTGDGVIEVGPRWTKQKHGAHCKTPNNYYNDHGVGICLVGNFEKTRPSAAQLAALRRLIAFLCAEGRISSDRIYTHGGVTRQTACPGRNFPSVATLRPRGAVAASDLGGHK